MKKQWSILSAALCVALLTGGCGTGSKNDADTGKKQTFSHETREENEHQSSLDVLQPSAYGNVQGLDLEKGSSISIIGRGSSSAYWKTVQEGAKQAIADINTNLGYKGNDKVKLVYSAPETENDVDDQVNILDEELARYPVAVGIAAVDSAACEVQFDLAAENGIPIVAFDSGTDYQNIVSMIDTDNTTAAATAASKLCNSIGESGQVLVIAHDSKSTSSEEREQGFVQEVEKNDPDVTVAETWHLDDLDAITKEINADSSEESSQETADDVQKAEEETADTRDTKAAQQDAIKYLLEKYPDVKGIFTTNETAADLVVNVLDSMDKTGEDRIKVVSFDGGEDQMKLLEDGKIDGLIVQNPYGIGYATVVACARAVLGQGNEATVSAGYTWVTKDNMDKESIKKMLY